MSSRISIVDEPEVPVPLVGSGLNEYKP